MQEWSEYLKFLVGLIAILNPLGISPVFINLTQQQSIAERRQTALHAAVSVGVVLLIALLAGELVLSVFGISISSFRVGALYARIIVCERRQNRQTSAL